MSFGPFLETDRPVIAWKPLAVVFRERREQPPDLRIHGLHHGAEREGRLAAGALQLRIAVKLRRRDVERLEAAVLGAKQVAFPILVGTLTTICRGSRS